MWPKENAILSSNYKCPEMLQTKCCSLAASMAATECVMFSHVLFLMLHFLWTFVFSMFCTHCLMCSFPEEHIQHIEQCNLTEVTGVGDRGCTANTFCSLMVPRCLLAEFSHITQTTCIKCTVVNYLIDSSTCNSLLCIDDSKRHTDTILWIPCAALKKLWQPETMGVISITGYMGSSAQNLQDI